MRCRSGDHCSHEALEGKRFCGPHQEQLDRVRVEMKEHALRRMGRKGKMKRTSICSRQGCTEPKESGSNFCEICIEAGFDQVAA